jgi:hypothetical protein
MHAYAQLIFFLTSGKYVQEADNLRKKEERKLIAGYSSGRKTLEVGCAGKN